MKIKTKEEFKDISNEKIIIPELYKDAWVENCDNKIKHWIENRKEKTGLYLYGGCGTGKTYTLYAIYRNAILNGYRSRIYNVVELLRLFKKDFNLDERNFEKCLDYEGVLFLDDLGAEKNSEFVDETLYHLINTRNEKMLPTLFSSNLSLKELAEKNGDRLASRIVEMCEVVELKGEDKRLI